MNYDNKYTDQKLQDVENQSLPDLSKMDEHWQQMSLLLQPGTTSVEVKKNIFRTNIFYAVVGVALIMLIAFFLVRNRVPVEESSLSVKQPASGQTSVVKDTTLPIKAGAIVGTDSLTGAIPIKTSEPRADKTVLLERFYQQIQKEPQAFVIDNRRDTVIFGKEGTQLRIPANAFEGKDAVTVFMTEFYRVDDMITQKLTTTCDGRQLITGGMVYLDARDTKDRLVDLKKGTFLRLNMAGRSSQPGMELFYGYEYYRNDLTNVIDSINWTRTGQIFGNGRIDEISLNKKTRKMDTLRVDGEFKDPKYPYNYYLSDSVDGVDLSRKADSISLRQFGVNINRLGWINCDRFLQDPRPKVDLIVDLGDDPDNYNTFLVFENLNSILRGSSRQGNSIRFSNLPSGETARIVSVGVKGNATVTAVKNLVVSAVTIHDLKFEAATALAFRKKSMK